MEAVMDTRTVEDIISHFKALSAVVPLRPIRTQTDYVKAVGTLNQLLDAGAADENHPLADLVETLGELIGDYEDTNIAVSDVSGVAMLRFLMDQHSLRQSDLPEIGTQGVVSEVLNGKRDLNTRQIRALSERFHVSPAIFLDTEPVKVAAV